MRWIIRRNTLFEVKEIYPDGLTIAKLNSRTWTLYEPLENDVELKGTYEEIEMKYPEYFI